MDGGAHVNTVRRTQGKDTQHVLMDVRTNTSRLLVFDADRDGVGGHPMVRRWVWEVGIREVRATHCMWERAVAVGTCR